MTIMMRAMAKIRSQKELQRLPGQLERLVLSATRLDLLYLEEKLSKIIQSRLMQLDKEIK